MNPKRKLQIKCDKLCYEKYLQKNCEICGGEAHQLHHYFPKSHYSHLRFNPDNLISLCIGCHFRLTHVDKRLEDKIREKRGEKWFKALQKKAYKRPPPSYLTLAYYNQVLKELEK